VVVKFVHPRQLLKSANPDGTSVIVLVVDAYPGADMDKVTVPVPASAWTYTGVLLLTEPAKTMRLTLLVPFTTVPSVVRLVESRAFVGSPLVIVTVSLPAGAGTPKLALIPFCKFTPTVVLPKLNVGVLTVVIYNLLLLSVEKPAGVPAILIVVVPTLNGWKALPVRVCAGPLFGIYEAAGQWQTNLQSLWRHVFFEPGVERHF
jgi:hypothetical protein